MLIMRDFVPPWKTPPETLNAGEYWPVLVGAFRIVIAENEDSTALPETAFRHMRSLQMDSDLLR